jgi:hypothetical protein
MSFENFEGQTALWIQRLQEHNFTSEHRQGRRPCRGACTHCHNVDARADVKTMRSVAAVAAAGWDPAALGTEPRHKAHPGGIRDRTVPRMEKTSPSAAPRTKATGL